MPDLFRSVRVRLTLAATVVTAIAVLLAGFWLVRTVDGTLHDRQRDQDAQRLAELRAELEQGRRPGELEVVVPGRTTFFEVRLDGRTVAATPGYEDDGGRYLRTTALVDTPSGTVELVAASPVEPIDRSVDAVRSGLLLAFPLLVAIVAALSWVLAGRALRPVEAIRAEVEAISGSTLDRRVPVPASGDEVARLADTMNAMLDRLEGAATRQQRFVADASHELRSPVAAIRTELEVAQRTAGADDWPLVAERLLSEEARLEAVITDLLLLASLDEGAPLPGPVSVDLADEARSEVARRTGRAEVDLVVDAPVPVVVEGSRTQLRRALGNLLDNADRHASGAVRVSVHEVDGWAQVVVDDDGPGIPPADRDRVFERFTRLDEHRGRNGAAGRRRRPRPLARAAHRRATPRHGPRRHVAARRRPAGARPPRAALTRTLAAIEPTSAFSVAPGTAVDLSAVDPRDTGSGPADKAAGRAATKPLVHRLAALQEVFWARRSERLLVVLQGIDTAGKGGTVSHVFAKVNPAGLRVTSFKAPEANEVARDFLWRVHAHVPADGEIAVFDRSHYEDVLAVRVLGLVPEVRWRPRFEHINDFERMLVDEGTTIVKLFLHISKDEQKARLEARLREPHKRWKFEAGDLTTRADWDDYQRAFDEMLSRTSTAHAPWHVIPADRKWFRNWAVAQILVDALSGMDLAWPDGDPGLADIVVE